MKTTPPTPPSFQHFSVSTDDFEGVRERVGLLVGEAAGQRVFARNDLALETLFVAVGAMAHHEFAERRAGLVHFGLHPGGLLFGEARGGVHRQQHGGVHHHVGDGGLRRDGR